MHACSDKAGAATSICRCVKSIPALAGQRGARLASLRYAPVRMHSCLFAAGGVITVRLSSVSKRSGTCDTSPLPAGSLQCVTGGMKAMTSRAGGMRVGTVRANTMVACDAWRGPDNCFTAPPQSRCMKGPATTSNVPVSRSAGHPPHAPGNRYGEDACLHDGGCLAPAAKVATMVVFPA